MAGRHGARRRLVPAVAAVAVVGTAVAGFVYGQPLGELLALLGDGRPTVAPSRSPTPVGEAAETPPSIERLTIAATGDVLVHSSVAERAATPQGGFDFRPMFADVRPLIRAADLSICHLETPLSLEHTDLSSYPQFNVPKEVAEALASAGFDSCSTASNHSLDQGVDGIDETLEILDREGIRHAGTARTPREARRTTLLRAGKLRVAHLSYTYGLNGLLPPEGQEWRVNLIDPGRIRRAARAARSRGADLVVVSLHWGLEYQHRPTGSQRTLARQVLSGNAVDLILGHHAHVVQPIRRLRGGWVAFGLGNFLSGQSAACCPVGTEDGLILHVTLAHSEERVRILKVRYAPTWVHSSTYRVLPVGQALANGPSGPLESALMESWRRTREVLRGFRSDGLPLKSP